MDRLDAMRLLLSVADRGSFSAASRELGVPLATVSRKINELETHLGAKLLIRTTRKVALTDTGAAYLDSARRILEDVEEAERIAAGEFQSPRGELTLTAPVLFGRLHILPVVVDFLAAHVTVFTGMRVEPQYGDSGPVQTKFCVQVARQYAQAIYKQRLTDCRGNRRQRQVGCGQRHSQLVRGQHHHHSRGVSGVCQKLGVTTEGNSGFVDN